MGTYTHIVGSLHLYESDRSAVQAYVNEGWQSTTHPMPEMPLGDPWSGIGALLSVERALREGAGEGSAHIAGSDPYWTDLGLLLEIFQCWKAGNHDRIGDLIDRFHSDSYTSYLRGRLEDVRRRKRRSRGSE